jgi:uncharacterized protein YkwD
MNINLDGTRKYFGIAVLAAAAALVGPLVGSDAPRQAQLKESFRLEMLQLINRDRVAAGLHPVELDTSYNDFVDEYCAVQIRNRTTGHFTLDGFPPYLRYSLAGGNDGVSENAAAWSANYRFPASSVLDMIRKSQASMLSERAPHDGHRRTLLDPDATHVALGLAWEGGEFRLVQEFLRRYVTLTREVPRSAKIDDRILIEGRPLPGVRVEAVSVHHEPMPVAMSRQLANAIENYGLPKARRDYYVEKVAPRQTSSRVSLARAAERNETIKIADDGSFSFVPPFKDGPGLYTVVLWVTRGGNPISATNITIQVDGTSSTSFPPLGTR